MKSLLKIACLSIFVLAAVAWGGAQSTTSSSPSASFPTFNPPPCDFNNTFYAENGIDSSSTSELNAEPDGRFGTFRQTGPPATGNQKNWVADSNCDVLDPTRRNFRILATTGGNSDDGDTPFTCCPNGAADAPNPSVGSTVFPPPTCQTIGTNEGVTVEFINIIAFLHQPTVFLQDPAAINVGFINGGLDGVQQNPGENISIGDTLTLNGQTVTEGPGNNIRGISMETIVSNFEAYGSIDQVKTSITCNASALAAGPPFTAQTPGCTSAAGQLSLNPCSLDMIQQFQNPSATTIPMPCFPVADTTTNGVTLSDVATPNLGQNWRFGTNRFAIDGTDNNCINNTNCGTRLGDSPFGYFCDDLLGMWVITYQWFTAPPPKDDPNNLNPCTSGFQLIAQANGSTADGYPIILSSNELDGNLAEGGGCMAEGREDGGTTETAGSVPGDDDGGALWLVCPAIPDPRNGGIAPDAFLDEVTSNGSPVESPGDPIATQFKCLQTTGKFCFESAPGQ